VHTPLSTAELQGPSSHHLSSSEGYPGDSSGFFSGSGADFFCDPPTTGGGAYSSETGIRGDILQYVAEGGRALKFDGVNDGRIVTTEKVEFDR